MNKKKIRKDIFKLRNSIVDRQYKQNSIIKKLKNIISNNTINIAGYYPTNNEVSLLKFYNFLMKNDYNIALPFIFKKKSHLLFKSYKLDTKLVIDKFKIKVPINSHFMNPKIIIVPLVAFDSNKNRLGYGGGYYDRTISFLEKKGEVFKIGVGFDEQEVKNLPFYQYDKKLDVVVTPTRLIT